MNNEIEVLNKKIRELILFYNDALDTKNKRQLDWIIKVLYEIYDRLCELEVE